MRSDYRRPRQDAADGATHLGQETRRREGNPTEGVSGAKVSWDHSSAICKSRKPFLFKYKQKGDLSFSSQLNHNGVFNFFLIHNYN